MRCVFTKKTVLTVLLPVLAVILVLIVWIGVRSAHHKVYRIYENADPDYGTFEDACRGSDLIVRAKVSKVGAAFRKGEGHTVLTPVLFDITHTYKGNSSVHQVVLYENYGEYQNATWLYYPPELYPQIPMKPGDELILFLQTQGVFSVDAAALVCYGAFASVDGDTATMSVSFIDLDKNPNFPDNRILPLQSLEQIIRQTLWGL